MGWSCNADASKTLDRITQKCRAQSEAYIRGGMSNVYTHKGTAYIIEISRTEHYDGAITGSILKVVEGSAYADSCRCTRAGSFRIEGNGSLLRGPSWLKILAQ